MRKCTEAVRLLAELDAELAESAAALGMLGEWSPEEVQLLKQIGDAVTRKAALARAFDKATSASARVTISAELRHLETQVAAMVKAVRAGLPNAPAAAPAEPRTLTSMKASKAAQTRWKHERLAKGQ